MKKFFSAFIFFIFIAVLSAAPAMNSKIRSVPKETQEKVFSKPKEGLPLLVNYLIQNAGSANIKVKILHDWICDNISYDAETYFSGKRAKQDYVSVLKKKKALCSGYSNLMNEMCRLANIESIVISGFSKGFGYSGKLDRGPDHDWNAVNINGKWQLVDVTWDAGRVDWKTYVKNYSDEWLFLEPKYFIYSHLPENDEYQFLKEIKTKEEFVREPYVSGKFFRMGFSFGKEMPDYNTVLSSEKEFDFNISQPQTQISCEIFDKSNSSEVQNAAWVNRTGNSFTINIDVPDSNNYEACIFAKKLSEENYGERFPIAQFEGKFLPQAEYFFENKKITEQELNFFKEAFFKVEENGFYYLYEDLFATQRNNAIKKIFKLLELPPSHSEQVLDFNIKTDGSYEGFGTKLKYPSYYYSYTSATNTKLISPVTGVLNKGETVLFEIATKNYTGIAVNSNGSLTPLKKDPKTGIYSGEITVEDNEEIIVYGTRNGKNYEGLWFYSVK
jgi:hypothetical protein